MYFSCLQTYLLHFTSKSFPIRCSCLHGFRLRVHIAGSACMVWELKYWFRASARVDQTSMLAYPYILNPGLQTLGTEKAHKHKHFIGISLSHWASL